MTTPLPWTHLSPASITDHLEESTITGTRLMSGSAAMSWRNVTIAACGVEHPLVHVHVDHLGAALHLLARDLERRPRSRPSRMSLRELARAGDVGPLADVDEELSGPMVSGSSPLSRSRGSGRGALAAARRPRTASAIARMCAGVVPQQPPTMFTSPLLGELAEHARPCTPGVSS